MSTYKPMQAVNPQLTALGPHDHPCLIYETSDEQADAFVPYLSAGLLQNELCVYVVDETRPEFIKAAFEARGVEVSPFVETGALRIITKHEAYLTDGYFDIDKMMSFWRSTVSDALQRGYSAVRAAAEMTWALGNEPGVEQLVEYESALNNVFPQLKVSALCQYHRKRFPAHIIKEMIHVHPLIVTGDATLKNPGFIRHSQFIESHDQMEVQAMLDNIALANRLQLQNEELKAALAAQSRSETEAAAYKKLQEELQCALRSETDARNYAEAVKQELEEFVANASEGLHWVGQDGTILWANKAELDFLGYSADEYVGRNIREFHADQDAIDELFTRLKSKETVRNFETQLVCKDNSRKTVLISSNVLWREGKFVHTQCFTRDITDLKLAQMQASKTEQIRALNEELHTLSRVMSHELQEPIAKIRSYLSLLEVRYKGKLGADADEFINTCTESAKIIHRMIDDLWLYSRMLHTHNSEVAAVSTGSVVAGILHEYKDQIAAANAEITVGDLPRVRYCEKQISYLFESLLNNALRYGKPNAHPIIAISARHEKNDWIFSVSDNGIGIDRMFLRDIFKAFYRIGARPGEQGTGMGLSICQKIVQSRGGTIWAESELGEGTTIFFTVPSQESV